MKDLLGAQTEILKDAWTFFRKKEALRGVYRSKRRHMIRLIRKLCGKC